MGSLPSLLERARHNDEAELEILELLEVFPSTLPTKRDSVYSGWVSISVGCNNTCTFCIVPSLRGKEKDRRPGDILNEIRLLGRRGDRGHAARSERQLLRRRVRRPPGVRKLLRAAGEIEGLERIRFTSPHPAAFTDDVIDAMADTPAVMPQLHMPLQSGSDRILKAMRRSYRSKRFLGILDRVRERMPHAAITTDIIVGFPGETDEDFEETMRVVEASRFSAHSRSSTPSARARPPRRCPIRCRRPSCRSASSASVGPHLAGGEPEAGGSRAQRAGVDGRGQEGCRDPSPDRPRRRQPARALRTARGLGGPCVLATW